MSGREDSQTFLAETHRSENFFETVRPSQLGVQSTEGMGLGD